MSMSLSADLAQETADLLGVKSPKVNSLQELRKAVDKGLPESSIDAVLHELTPDGRRMVTLVQMKTAREKGSAVAKRHAVPRLPYAASEQTARIARVIALARLVWRNNRSKVNQFLTKPHPMLGDEPPLKVAQSDIGARQVEDILWKIVFGLPA